MRGALRKPPQRPTGTPKAVSHEAAFVVVGPVPDSAGGRRAPNRTSGLPRAYPYERPGRLPEQT